MNEDRALPQLRPAQGSMVLLDDLSVALVPMIHVRFPIIDAGGIMALTGP